MYTLPSCVTFFERGWLSSNSILLLDDKKSILVDTGYWTHAPQTEALIRNVIAERKLDIIINTHLHSDHCGGNAHLQDRYPLVETFIPPGHANYVDDWNAQALTYEPTGQHCPKFKKTGVLRDGDYFEVNGMTWRTYAAAGHDPNAIILFNEELELLISADALWENGFGVVFPEIEGIQAFDEVESTLQIIEQLKPQWILPGHGAGFGNVSSALVRARSRLTQFRTEPDKHAIYAAKVLLKFKLLELQRATLADLYVWAESSSYLQLLHKEYSKGISFRNWINQLCSSLEKSHACKVIDEYVINI